MLISVIIPVYKAEKYIEQCVRSLIEQSSHDDYELIIVDDCTPDKSINLAREVVDSYGDNAPPVRFLNNTTNLGTATTRNLGLKVATGDYIAFVDSDDYVVPNYIETIKNYINSEKFDVLLFDYYEVCGTKNQLKTTNPPQTNFEIIYSLFVNKLHNCLWNKVFKKSLFDENNISMPDGMRVFEDKSICFKLFYFAKSIKYISNPLYYYNCNNVEALTKDKSNPTFESSLQVANIIDDFFKDHQCNPSIRKAIVVNKLHIAGSICLYGSDKQVLKYKQMYKDIPFNLFITSAKIPWHYRVAVFGYKYKIPILARMVKHALYSYQKVKKK